MDTERAIAMHQQAIDRLLDRAARDEEARALFGGDNFLEWPDETVILFKRNFGGAQREPYVYTALKVNGCWYISGANAPKRASTPVLIRDYLVPAWRETGEVWVVSEWTIATAWVED